MLFTHTSVFGTTKKHVIGETTILQTSILDVLKKQYGMHKYKWQKQMAQTSA
jgi:hypothetical protein